MTWQQTGMETPGQARSDDISVNLRVMLNLPRPAALAAAKVGRGFSISKKTPRYITERFALSKV